MVVPLGPGKFYGSSLPRPRIFTDTKLNPERVDPPVSVMDPLLSWANEAHWNMGGLNFKRVRLQGRIEGSISKLRIQREKFEKAQIKQSRQRVSSVSPPAGPVAVKRRRFLALSDEEEGEEKEAIAKKKKSSKRKLISDFDMVADDDSVGVRAGGEILKRDDEIMIIKEASPLKTKRVQYAKTGGIRTSPRLAKRGSN